MGGTGSADGAVGIVTLCAGGNPSFLVFHGVALEEKKRKTHEVQALTKLHR